MFNSKDLSILCIGSFLFGYGIAFPGMTIKIISKDLNFNNFEISLFSALSSLSAVTGPFLSNFLLKKNSRKNSTKIISILSIFSYFLLIINNLKISFLSLIHRFLLGITIGAFSSIIPLYINEVSPLNKKTIYGTMNQFGIAFGVAFVNFIGIYFNWKILSIFGLIFSFLLLDRKSVV